MRSIIVFMLGLASCAPVEQPAHAGYKDSEFVNYSNEFSIKYNVSLDPVSITFVQKISANYIGLCNGGEIIILKGFWDLASNTTKRNMIFHELGHCALARTHKLAVYPDGCPLSIMFPDIISDYCYNKYAQELDKEMGDHKYE